MDNVTLEQIRELRKLTGNGLHDCKTALQNSNSIEEAIVYLRRLGAFAIQKYDTSKSSKLFK